MDRARGKEDGKIGGFRDRKPKALEAGGRGRGGRHNISLGQDVNSVFFFVFLEEIDLIVSDFLQVSRIDRP